MDLLLPPTCLFCRRPLLPGERHDFLCAPCLQKEPFFLDQGCFLCAGRPGHSFCCTQGRARSFSFSGTTALGWYGSDLRECLHRLKYGGCSHLAKPLGLLLARSVLRRRSWPPFQAVVPIPLHPKRLRERGYNQSYLLARNLSRSINVPLAELLERQKDTPPQTRLPRNERLHNLKGAFRLKAKASPSFKASTLLLVDDIFTTGTTMNEAAKLLVGQGAGGVYNAVVAR